MEVVPFSKKQLFNSGFLAGLLAGALASGMMVLLSLIAGGISLPEAPGSAIVQSSVCRKERAEGTERKPEVSQTR